MLCSGARNEGGVPGHCAHDCPCDAPKQRLQSRQQPTRSIREVENSEGFTRNTEVGRKASFRLANRCRSRPERNISVRRIDAPRRVAERALLARLFWRQAATLPRDFCCMSSSSELFCRQAMNTPRNSMAVLATRPTMIREESRTARPPRVLTDERG